MKTSELTGRALDYAAGLADGYSITLKPTEQVYVHPNGTWHHNGNWSPSTNALQGLPIIERHKISLIHCREGVRASTFTPTHEAIFEYGPDMLTAGLRAVVATILGPEVDIPKELA